MVLLLVYYNFLFLYPKWLLSFQILASFLSTFALYLLTYCVECHSGSGSNVLPISNWLQNFQIQLSPPQYFWIYHFAWCMMMMLVLTEKWVDYRFGTNGIECMFDKQHCENMSRLGLAVRCLGWLAKRPHLKDGMVLFYIYAVGVSK